MSIPAIFSIKSLPLNTALITPLGIRGTKYLSAAGSLAAAAAIIYGIFANIVPFIAMGAFFLAISFSNVYLIHRIADLKTIEEDSAIIKTLDEKLSVKEAQIRQLTLQLRGISDKFARQNIEYARLSQAENTFQKQLNHELQRSAELLAKTEAEAQKKIELFRTSMAGQLQQLQKQSEIDQQTVANLNRTVAKAKDQNDVLQINLADLQKQVAAYQQQIKNYSALNDQLQKKIKTLSEAMQFPDIDISSVNAHSASLEEALIKQKTAAEKAAKAAAQVNRALDALNKRLSKPSTV